mmetsp:Transcript_4129/g.11939  ORF Transcript_4129/g.11939 Transcript_4129/m.11939 type:complete len:389 (-) Transcript_4129:1809-2975(-)
MAAHESRARGRAVQTGEKRDGCRLACTVRAEEAKAFARLDLEGEVFQRHLAIAIHLAQREDLHGGIGREAAALDPRALCGNVLVLAGINIHPRDMLQCCDRRGALLLHVLGLVAAATGEAEAVGLGHDANGGKSRVEVQPEGQNPEHVRAEEPEGEGNILRPVQEIVREQRRISCEEDGVVVCARWPDEVVPPVPQIAHSRAAKLGAAESPQVVENLAHDDDPKRHRAARRLEAGEERREDHGEAHLHLRPHLRGKEEHTRRAHERAHAHSAGESPEDEDGAVAEDGEEEPLHRPVGPVRHARHAHGGAQLKLLLAHEGVARRDGDHGRGNWRHGPEEDVLNEKKALKLRLRGQRRFARHWADARQNGPVIAHNLASEGIGPRVDDPL